MQQRLFLLYYSILLALLIVHWSLSSFSLPPSFRLLSRSTVVRKDQPMNFFVSPLTPIDDFFTLSMIVVGRSSKIGRKKYLNQYNLNFSWYRDIHDNVFSHELSSPSCKGRYEYCGSEWSFHTTGFAHQHLKKSGWILRSTPSARWYNDAQGITYIFFCCCYYTAMLIGIVPLIALEQAINTSLESIIARAYVEIDFNPKLKLHHHHFRSFFYCPIISSHNHIIK